MKGIGVLPGAQYSFIDHLVPLCALMEIPLLCTDRAILETVALYYPEIPLILAEPEGYSLDHALEGYDVLFYVDHYRQGHGTFQFNDYICRKSTLRSVWALHGNSDKKRNLYWMERCLDEDIVLIYGPHMEQFLAEKGVLSRLKHVIPTGNFRYEYYLQHQPFFDARAALYLPREPGQKTVRKTVLYAPTWVTPRADSPRCVDDSTFFEAYLPVLETLPDDLFLLVKLHPDLERHFGEAVSAIRERYASKDNISFITECPLIYPILSKVDIYLGDYSSIGYDFLHFDRPLFFLGAAKEGDLLYNAGRVIAPSEYHRLYEILGEETGKNYTRVEMYETAFGKRKGLAELRKEIENAYQKD